MTELLGDYGLVLLFAIVAVQAMGIGGPPGKTALVVAALLAADGVFPIWQVVAVAAAAGTLGGYAGYWIARRGGRRLVERLPLAARLHRPLSLAETFFAQHGGKAVFLARFFPGLKVVAAPAAGLSRMPWPRFALWHALGAIAFALLFGLGSYYAGAAALELVERYGTVALLPVIAAALLAWVLVVRRRRAAARALAG